MSRSGDGAVPVEIGDALAVVGFAGEVVDGAIDARVATALDATAAAALVAGLDDLRRAMAAGGRDAARGVRGLFARLAGRDVHAEAEAARLRERTGVLLLAADRAADAVAAQAAAQEALHRDLGDALATLDARLGDARAWLAAHPSAGLDGGAPVATPRARFEGRLQQLDTVHAAWTLAQGQLALVRDQQLDLLARYRRIRDVLLPAWRQQALAVAAGTGAAHARAAADAQAAIASEVDAMTARLDHGAGRQTPSGEGR